MSIRRDFYADLRKKFLAGPSESYLFRYLLEERLADGKKEDFTHTPLEELLELLADRNQKLQLKEQDRRWLWALGARAGGGELWEKLEATRGNREQYKLILEALRGRPEVVTGQELDKLRRMVLEAAVMRDAWTFLYDAGFSPKQPEERPARKKDRLLEMLDGWCNETGRFLCQGGASGSGALTGAERQAWNEMFLLLQNRKEPIEVMLPVRVDPRTGVGLYLVSAKYLTAEVQRQLKQEHLPNCIFMCLGPSYIPETERFESDDINEKIYNEFRLYMGPLMDDKAYCVTLEDGERMFSYILDSPLAYDFFCDLNATAPPGTPKMLLDYFRPAQQESDRDLAGEGRRAFEQDAQCAAEASRRIRA